ncbi:MAG TPA: heparan-alpha-glucosaminide N-acetyltransferase domain-containing protein, partial [Candidatus Acidoferrales bacterium]|nr:heparan-alpha-glucosaminide N-acetyltransferase domain-containing protein [Candidatus Acidoferrales bacterium]
VDILNMMGLSMMAMGALCRLARTRAATILSAAAVSFAIALATPPLWTTLRPRWLPWPLESYINGVHTYPDPRPWLFPIFPWAAIAFAGLAVGFILFSDWAKKRESLTAGLIGGGGVVLYLVAQWLDAAPLRLYASYDYWHTSPNFFLARVGILLMILFASYAWCRWGAGAWKFSPMIQLGQTSLLVYWVHIEFVYGRFSILPKQAVSISTASLGLLAIFVAMLLLSMARTRLKGRGAEALIWLRRAARPAREG